MEIRFLLTIGRLTVAWASKPAPTPEPTKLRLVRRAERTDSSGDTPPGA